MNGFTVASDCNLNGIHGTCWIECTPNHPHTNMCICIFEIPPVQERICGERKKGIQQLPRDGLEVGPKRWSVFRVLQTMDQKPSSGEALVGTNPKRKTMTLRFITVLRRNSPSFSSLFYVSGLQFCCFDFSLIRIISRHSWQLFFQLWVCDWPDVHVLPSATWQTDKRPSWCTRVF